MAQLSIRTQKHIRALAGFHEFVDEAVAWTTDKVERELSSIEMTLAKEVAKQLMEDIEDIERENHKDAIDKMTR